MQHFNSIAEAMALFDTIVDATRHVILQLAELVLMGIGVWTVVRGHLPTKKNTSSVDQK